MRTASDRPYASDGDGVRLFIRLTPKGGRDSVDAVGHLADGRSVLLARVRAAPDKGAANEALIALVARWSGRPKSSVTLVAGSTARLKEVHVVGAHDVVARITALPVKTA